MNRAGVLSQKQLQFEFKNNECFHGKNLRQTGIGVRPLGYDQIKLNNRKMLKLQPGLRIFSKFLMIDTS